MQLPADELTVELIDVEGRELDRDTRLLAWRDHARFRLDAERHVTHLAENTRRGRRTRADVFATHHQGQRGRRPFIFLLGDRRPGRERDGAGALWGRRAVRDDVEVEVHRDGSFVGQLEPEGTDVEVNVKQSRGRKEVIQVLRNARGGVMV